MNKSKSTLSFRMAGFLYLRIPLFVTLVAAFLILQISSVHAKNCATSVSDTKHSDEIERAELIRLRSIAIVEHQNSLRNEAGLRAFEAKDFEPNLKKKPPKKINSDKRYIVVNAKIVLIKTEDDLISLALGVDDVYSLNYVYRFEGTRIKEAIPASVYYISEMSDVVTLHRGLKSEEKEMWIAKDLEGLRSHPKAIGWGYNVPRTHLSTEFFHGAYTPSIKFDIPKSVLLKWAVNKQLTIGSEGDRSGTPYRFEFVIKGSAWEELIKYLWDH